MNRSHLTDDELLQSAWDELAAAPKAIGLGNADSLRSVAFMADFGGGCPRCGKSIEVGATIRYHRDYSTPVHSGCHELRQPLERALSRTKPAVQKPVPMCSVCRLEHQGECF